ncbi:hypothetical protein [Roseibium sp. RKSG952]|nr:hypothetical protein [Roseibium sp. RKSG952]
MLQVLHIANVDFGVLCLEADAAETLALNTRNGGLIGNKLD